MKGNLKFTLLVVAILVTFFVLARKLIETRAELKRSHEQIAQQIREKFEIENELKGTQSKLARTEFDLRHSRHKLGFVDKKLRLVKNDNAELRRVKFSLKERIFLLEKEKEVMEARLHDLNELKKAIYEVKREIRQQKIARQKDLDARELELGNRGFIVKDGKPFTPPKVKIEVRPAGLSLKK